MESIIIKEKEPLVLREAWQGIQEAKPGIRIRDAAKSLEVSEAELLATTVGESCVRLDGKWQDFAKSLPQLGYIMSLTRNEGCVLEHKGEFRKVATFGKGDHQMGTSVGPIETRIFFRNWHVAFAVEQEKKDRILRSFQIFDKAGEAITKIYLQEKSNETAFWELLKTFRSDDQSTYQEVTPYDAIEYSSKVDKSAFLKSWSNLNDTHDFFPMLRKYNVSRYQAIELGYREYTYRVSTNSVEYLLDKAAVTKLPIMIFAGNRGNLQIHQDQVRTIRWMEKVPAKWLNVLDREFNMHLRMDLVASAWVVEKPTKDSTVLSLELFDENNEMVVQFFGLRKPGVPQNDEWKKLISELQRV